MELWIIVFVYFNQTMNCSNFPVKSICDPLLPMLPLSVGKYFFRFVDVENAKILSSKMIFDLSHLLKVSPMKCQYFPLKCLCFL